MGGVCTPPGSGLRTLGRFCTISVHTKSFRIRTYGPSRKCSLYRTYRKAKSFRIRTYKKQGGGGVMVNQPSDKDGSTRILMFLSAAAEILRRLMLIGTAKSREISGFRS